MHWWTRPSRASLWSTGQSEHDLAPASACRTCGDSSLLAELVETSDSEPDTFSGPTEVPIPGDEDDFLVTEFECGGQMDRVIAAQPEIFGVPTGTTGELLIDANRRQLRIQLFEGRECLPVLLLPEAI